MGKFARDAVSALTCRATWGGSQNFLGARWVERVVDGVPEAARERVALRFLALSPHYFYDRDLAAEASRNRQSRQILADGLVVPHLAPDARVLDFGCGPGYLADGSPAGRARLRYGLNCFARSAAEMTGLVTRAGFTDAVVCSLNGRIAIPGDDIPEQYLLTARR